MKDTLTISLPHGLKHEIQVAAKREGKSTSALAEELLRRQMQVGRFRAIRARLVPQARAKGIVTEEDVFRMIS